LFNYFQRFFGKCIERKIFYTDEQAFKALLEWLKQKDEEVQQSSKE